MNSFHFESIVACVKSFYIFRTEPYQFYRTSANSGNPIPPQSGRRHVERDGFWQSTSVDACVDICGLHPNICGMEAGCYSRGDSYVCLCHDLEPADANNNCDRTESPSSPTSSTDSSVTNVLLQVAPTEGSFGPHQLLGMLSTSKQAPSNLTESNSTQSNEPSHIIRHTSAGFAGLSAVLGTCLFALALLAICSLILFVYHRRKGALCWWLAADRRRNAAAMSLSKCMEQYIANPNYYSTSPDAPLLGMRHLQIPSDNVVLMEEIGEGCFGKVHKGIRINFCVQLFVASLCSSLWRNIKHLKHPIPDIFRGLNKGIVELAHSRICDKSLSSVLCAQALERLQYCELYRCL
ncbi:hypothetical protein AVEN_48526-1 [Araneus ventricosus]|uniref:Uncharacterized protein n=1 Tax=Araneus ventricosus TaxID=182803 RepID=A0A4Y2MZM1_ARAVE|nr:hypothetical protein AVEN_48526-1 [Araneus ventricosus]